MQEPDVTMAIICYSLFSMLLWKQFLNHKMVDFKRQLLDIILYPFKSCLFIFKKLVDLS